MTPVPHSPATAAQLTGYPTKDLGAIVNRAVQQLRHPDPAWHFNLATLRDIRQTGLDVLHHRALTRYEVRQGYEGVIGWSVLAPSGEALEVGLSYQFARHLADQLAVRAGG